MPSFGNPCWSYPAGHRSLLLTIRRISPPREPHQLEWVGPMNHRPVTRSARAISCILRCAKVRDCHLEISSRPREERLPLRFFRRGTSPRFSEPRFRLPISATRFRHAGTPVSRRSSSVRGCRPSPRLLCSMPCSAEEPKSHAVCRSSPHRPSRATCRTFRCRELRPMVWPAGRRGELTELLR